MTTTTDLVLRTYPPNIDAIYRAFPSARHRKGVVFAYAPHIYAPGLHRNAWLPADVIAHEKQHFAQQDGWGPDVWWEKYIEDAAFRLHQEIEAYQAQWSVALCIYDRPTRRRALDQMVKALSGPLYNGLVSAEEARELIERGR